MSLRRRSISASVTPKQVAPGRLGERAAVAGERLELVARGHAVDHASQRPQREVLAEAGGHAHDERRRDERADERVDGAEDRPLAMCIAARREPTPVRVTSLPSSSTSS